METEKIKISDFKEITDSLAILLQQKNERYGNSTVDTFNKYGLISYMIRIEDKVNRLRTLALSDIDGLDESIEDTLMDLAGYAILTLKTLNDKKEVR